MEIRDKLKKVPASPGVYILKNLRGNIIYVGKAKNLRNRLRSYFQTSAALDARKSRMVQEVGDFEYTVTGNELEALVLEANYIKKVKPRYNIILRDDKNYPYLKLTLNEDWPRLEVVRKIKRDGAEYFGPYVPSGPMREMLRFIRRNFPVRMCRYNLKKPFRACVQYQMGRCLAPCEGSRRTERDRARYAEVVNEVKAFIIGEKRELLSSLQDRMLRCSEELEYEEAAEIRDRLQALERAWETQRVIAPGLGDIDVAGLYREGDESSVFVMFIRNGIVIGQKDFFLGRLAGIDDRELVSGFLEQFYSKEIIPPPRIIIPVKAEFPTLRKWLGRKKGSKVSVSAAKNVLEEQVLKMAADNALYSFNKHKDTRVDETLFNIKELLGLKIVPNKIAAFDISNLSGTEAAGALVVYEKGHFIKDEYRLFKIKTVRGSNDFAMMGEVIYRYLDKAGDSGKNLPQLLLVDGGRGQLESAVSVMKSLGLTLEIAAIAKAKSGASAKRREGVRRDIDRIYLPGRKGPVYLEPFLPSTLLLQKIRDEVHRSSVNYHKKLRSKRNLESPLEKVEGIGKKRRLLLLRHFGSIDSIRKASRYELESLKGMNKKAAENLKRFLEADSA